MTTLICPGGCGHRFNPNRPTCAPCWGRLPLRYRRAWSLLFRRARPLTDTTRERLTADVLAWFAANPAGPLSRNT